MTTETHAPQRNGITPLVAQPGTLHLQLSVLLDRFNGMYITCTHAKQ